MTPGARTLLRPGLLDWQWSRYATAHQMRTNLVVHAMTAPLFQAGCILLLSGMWHPGLALGGALAVVVALTLQGRGHRRETVRPEPFLGPADFVTRFFVEQWITFPRFVLTGGFASAWRSAAGSAPPTPSR